MEKRINKHVFAWVFCFLLGEYRVKFLSVE